MESRSNGRVAVFAALVVVQILFGLHYAVAKYILEFIPPRVWASMRIVPAAILLMAWVLMTRRGRIPTAGRDLASIALYAVFGVIINQIFFVEGLSRTATSHSAVINSFIPIATLLIAILLRYERATPPRIAGITLSLIGILYLIGHSGALLPRRFVIGDLLTLVNAASYSVFLVISKPILSRHSSLSVTAIMMVFGALVIPLLGLPQFNARDLAGLPPAVWWAAAFVVLFATLGTYILNLWALKRVDSSHVALFVYLQPVFAAIVAVAWLGEPLGIETLVSAPLIFGGMYLATRRRAC
jgi:drug/metabolite transporter (DMT)-like permease